MAVKFVVLAAMLLGAYIAPVHAKYKGTASKHRYTTNSWQDLGDFFIPAGQCDGVIDSSISKDQCPGGIDGLSVATEDDKPVVVSINNAITEADVDRTKPCAGQITVKIKVICK